MFSLAGFLFKSDLETTLLSLSQDDVSDYMLILLGTGTPSSSNESSRDKMLTLVLTVVVYVKFMICVAKKGLLLFLDWLSPQYFGING
jgi:hypothetical protein